MKPATEAKIYAIVLTGSVMISWGMVPVVFWLVLR